MIIHLLIQENPIWDPMSSNGFTQIPIWASRLLSFNSLQSKWQPTEGSKIRPFGLLRNEKTRDETVFFVQRK